jgi:hypothetical protein
MQEGWIGDDYVVLFEASEIASASDRYSVGSALPGFSVIGLWGWDDFIIKDCEGQLFTVPTVPMIQNHIAPLKLLLDKSALRSDDRFTGKIKWYVNPIVFGGDPEADENITWITHRQHVDLVRWWNNMYRTVSSQPGTN